MIVAMLYGVLSGIQPSSAKDGVSCRSGFGAKTPVLMVHGFNSSPDMWASMRATIDQNDNVVTELFNYEEDHQDWVTDPSIGPALADKISCLARESRRGRGVGKVIVIAHSMGGLAARYAANQEVDGRKVADDLGLVVTIGTPHMGSGLGNAGTAFLRWLCVMAFSTSGVDMPRDCWGASDVIRALSKHSEELAELPSFPSGIPVKAIAGDATVLHRIAAMGGIRHDTGSDMVVSVESATAEYTQTGHGDGKVVFECEQTTIRLAMKESLLCSHNSLPNDRSVQQEVKRGIEQYLESINKESSDRVEDFFGLLLQLDPSWKIGFENSYAKVVYDPDKCFDEGAVIRCSGFRVFNNAVSPHGRYRSSCQIESISGEEVYIGSKSAQYIERDVYCGGDDSTRHVAFTRTWWLPSARLTIETFDLRGDPLVGLDSVLAAARWR